MKVCEIVKTISGTIYTKYRDNDLDIKDVYCGDLLSNILGHAKDADCLVTIMANMNLIAVASLLDLPVIILAEGITPSKEMISKAEEENIMLISSSLSAVNIIRKIYQ